MSYFKSLKSHDDIIMLEVEHFGIISEKCKTEILRKDQQKRIKHFDSDETLTMLEWQKNYDFKQLSIYKNCLSIGNYKKVMFITEENLAAAGIFWQRKTLIFKELCMEVLKKTIQAYKIICERHNNNWPDEHAAPVALNQNTNQNTTSPKNNDVLATTLERLIQKLDTPIIQQPIIQHYQPPIATPQEPTLSFIELINLFNNSPEIQQKSKGMKEKFNTFQKTLLNCIDKDTDISKINRSHFRDLLYTLQNLPKNIGRLKEFENMPIAKIIQIAKANGNYELLSASSINDYLEHLQALLKWAKREGYNTFEDFSDIKAKKETNSKFDRMPFSKEQIKMIMLSDEVLESKNNIKHPELYWCLGVGIASMHYSGMEAMDVKAKIYYREDLFILSIAIAILASAASLYIMNWVRLYKKK